MCWVQLSTMLVGITTLVGGGTGPADGTRATTCTPAASHMKLMLQSTDDLPLNFGFTGKVRVLCQFSSDDALIMHVILFQVGECSCLSHSFRDLVLKL